MVRAMKLRTSLLSLLVLALAGCPPAPPDLRFESDRVGDLTTFPGIGVVPNVDDDNRNATADWDDDGDVADEDDRAKFTLPADVWEGVAGDEILRIELGGQSSSFRVYLGDRVVLGEQEGSNRLAFDLSAAEGPLVFGVEGREALRTATVSLRHLDADLEELGSFTTWMTTGPMLLNHHLQDTEHVWVMDVSFGGGSYNNRHMVETFEEVLGDQFTAFDAARYAGDVWIQDEVQFGWYDSPDSRIDLVIDSIRDRGLDDWPEDHFDDTLFDDYRGGPDAIIGTWGSGQANSLDSFGNLEISPPTTVDGVRYPFGRAYWGGVDGYEPAQEMTDFLADQLIQDPFRVDTSWLCVGHIDEFTTFVPDPSAPRGFRFVYADTDAAWDVLDAADPQLELTRYQQDYGIGTVAELVSSNAIRMLNEETQEDILDPILEHMTAELGLLDEEIRMMPSLFEEPWGCGQYQAALVPGMTNLIVANRDGGAQTDVFLADPFVRASANADVGQDVDPMIAAVTAMMPETVDLHFVDNWSVYHLGLGEVHCGTNMTRTPDAGWWNVAGHLIQDEVLQ